MPASKLPTCYYAADVASLLGHGLDWFYRHKQRLIAAGMPGPIVPFGRLRFDRQAMDAWINRHDPRRQQLPPAANDERPMPPPSSATEWRNFLRSTYGALAEPAQAKCEDPKP